MKILLAIALAGSLYAQTKNYNLNVVHLGAVNSTAATATRPFREVASASGACPVEGEYVSITGSAAVYKCVSLTWTLITGAGESITVSAPLSRSGDVISCPTCATTSVTSLTQLASVGVITSGVWQGTRVGLAYGGTSVDLSATGPGFLRQATTGAGITVAYHAYSDLTGIPSTFAPSAHATAHQHGGADQIATATPGANVIPKAGSDSKLASGFLTEVLTLANLSDVSGKQGVGTLVATVTGTLVQGNALTVDSSGSIVDSGVTPGGGGSSAFSAITSATNTQAAMVVGNGASLAATGTGTIAATSLSALTGLPNQADGTILANVSGGSAPASATTRVGLGLAASDLADCRGSYTSATVITIGGCPNQLGSVNQTTIAAASSSAAPSGSGTLRVYIAADGTPTLGYSTANTAAIAGWTATTLVSDFPEDSIPIATFTHTSGSWNSTVVNHRVLMRRDVHRPASGTALTRSCTNGACEWATDMSMLEAKYGSTVNTQTGTSYTYLDSDYRKLVTHTNGSAIAAGLPDAAGAGFDSGWYMDVQNRGAGTLTITPTTSTIDGALSLALTTGQGTRIFSDGTNYFTQRGVGGGGSVNEYISLCQNDWDPWNPSASTTYYGGSYINGQAANNGLVQFPSPVDGTIVGITVAGYASTAYGVGATTTVTVQKGGSDTSVAATIALTSYGSASGTGSTAVSKGDLLNYKLDFGAYSSAPVALRMRYCTLIKTN